ncbi:28S ribosomal protein S18a [Acropora cervicornis]|uniref:28S ribosomal protein S18a n=1 Tax=Acropora cervicornis TaxID=6130 RepID=A0AAD9QWK5_ACRCE|nr:28S ribosomal protein S18a [Acropora cervicornis]
MAWIGIRKEWSLTGEIEGNLLWLTLDKRKLHQTLAKRDFPQDIEAWGFFFNLSFNMHMTIVLSSQVVFKLYLARVKASVLTDDKINKADLGCPICSRDITFTYKASLKSEKKRTMYLQMVAVNVTQSNDFLVTKSNQDVLFLSQFMSPRGYILNRRVTGVCRKQQRKLEKAIKISQRLGLLPKLAPAVQKELEEKKLAAKRNAAQNKN